jgi:hypothetical protein
MIAWNYESDNRTMNGQTDYGTSATPCRQCSRRPGIDGSRHRPCAPRQIAARQFYSQHVTNRKSRNPLTTKDMKISTRNINQHSQSSTLIFCIRRLWPSPLATSQSPLLPLARRSASLGGGYPEQRANRNRHKPFEIRYIKISTRNSLRHSRSSSLTIHTINETARIDGYRIDLFLSVQKSPKRGGSGGEGGCAARSPVTDHKSPLTSFNRGGLGNSIRSRGLSFRRGPANCGRRG